MLLSEMFFFFLGAASNPVIQFDPVELQTQAAALVQQVDAFVEGDDFASGAPEGLVVSAP